MVTEKRISRMKRTFFIDNVKNMFVLSIMQTVSGTSTPIKSYCTIFDVLYNWKTKFGNRVSSVRCHYLLILLCLKDQLNAMAEIVLLRKIILNDTLLSTMLSPSGLNLSLLVNL